MPLFGKRKREEASSTPSREQVAAAALRLHNPAWIVADGHITLDILGPIDEAESVCQVAAEAALADKLITAAMAKVAPVHSGDAAAHECREP